MVLKLTLDKSPIDKRHDCQLLPMAIGIVNCIILPYPCNFSMQKMVSNLTIYMTHTYSVSGMTCSGCAATVKKSLASVSHVEHVDVDLAKGIAEIVMTHHVPLAQLQT